MTSVREAENIILSHLKDAGTERLPFEKALGRVLAENIIADRDLPPYDRVTMDGIAIHYSALANGINSFHIKATQAAGDTPIDIDESSQCIEIMTGAALAGSVDTVIRYEDLEIKDGVARLTTGKIKTGQSVHLRGKDKLKNEIVVNKDQMIDAGIIQMAASLGYSELLVKRLPKVLIVSTGDELVEVSTIPQPFQVRRSNSYAMKAVLQQYSLHADMLHIPDDYDKTKQELQKALNEYDAIILSGGISMGKFDHVPKVLEELLVKQLFYKVQQRPGKPFWFGTHASGALVFAFPGNPVSTFMCLHRYFVPWLLASIGIPHKDPIKAILNNDFSFAPELQYFLQVKLSTSDKGELLASPIEGNGSGDFANLLYADAFMELPAEKHNFKKGEVYRIWPYKPLFS